MSELDSELEDRLVRCFASVFPALSEDEIRAASADSSGVWDSLATVTLGAVIEEEFSVAIDPNVLPDLDSFKAFLACLRQAGVN